MGMIFGLAGGLALFIYGMNLMGEGLQKAAGEKMRRILEVLTKNPLMAILVGTLVTSIIQSSSATTVMVVGFVSAGLMTLPQAIGVIFGANIGTTVTAQIVAFDIGDYAYPIAAIGFLLMFLSKRKSIRYFGQIIFAFGVLFIGLNTMGDAMKPLGQSKVFSDIVLRLGKSPILGLLVGAIGTGIIQSSSAFIAVLQNLASTPVDNAGNTLINLQTALPILFGSNIGTTVTALLASIGASINAKRAAVAHTVFNVFGSVVFMFFIPSFSKLVQLISPAGPEAKMISRQIANAHTGFNLINTIIWLPLIPVLAKIVKILVPGKEKHIEKGVLYLDKRMLRNPPIAMNLATKELTRMAVTAQQMMQSAKKSYIFSDMDEAKKVHEYEETVDKLQCEIISYLSMMLSMSALTSRQSVRLTGLMHVANDIERIGDYCQNIAESAEIKEDENLPFSDEAIKEIKNAFEEVNAMVDDTIHALNEGNIELARKALSKEKDIDELEKSLRSRHLERLSKGLCNPLSAISFVELVHNLERIADHCTNIAEAVIEDYKGSLDDGKGSSIDDNKGSINDNKASADDNDNEDTPSL
ncbi:MAG TPA: Na/Pi cotransporter family protein [Clostridiaceae bacterium]|nr:Na/Pi cotransporter family protein [Clostridiaceae bacterium]